MRKITFQAQAGRVSDEPTRRGVKPDAPVIAVIDVVGEQDSLPLAAVNQAGQAFEWLGREPDLYTDADLVKPSS